MVDLLYELNGKLTNS